MVLPFICTIEKMQLVCFARRSLHIDIFTWKYALAWIGFNKIIVNFEKLMFQNLKHLH